MRLHFVYLVFEVKACYNKCVNTSNCKGFQRIPQWIATGNPAPTNQKVRGSNPLRRTRNPDTQQGIGIFAMCGNGEKPCGVRLAPQRCFEANRRLRRLLGRDIPYAVPRPGTKVPGLLFSVKTIQMEKHTRSGVLFDYFSSSLCVLIRRK